MEIKNTTLDDIAAVIGFTATLRLSAWFGRRGNVYVPFSCEPKHLLTKLLGLPAAQRLSKAWPGQHLFVPGSEFLAETKRRQVADLLHAGLRLPHIGPVLGLTERRVQQVVQELLRDGLAVEMPPAKEPPENGLPETRWEKPAEKGPSKKPAQEPVPERRIDVPQWPHMAVSAAVDRLTAEIAAAKRPRSVSGAAKAGRSTVGSQTPVAKRPRAAAAVKKPVGPAPKRRR